MTIKSKYLVPIIHILLWLAFFFMPILLMTMDNNGNTDNNRQRFRNISPQDSVRVERMPDSVREQVYDILKIRQTRKNNQQNKYMNIEYWTSNVLIVVIFYLNIFVLFPMLYKRKRIALYFLSLIVLFFIFMYLPEWISVLCGKKVYKSRFFAPFFDRMLIMFLLTIACGWIYCLVHESNKQRERNKEIENQRVKTELQFLRLQIDPHFIFNTLNSIYYLSLVQSDKVSDAIMNFSKIMRYVTSESTKEAVPLSTEIEYLQQYIDLQKMRLNDKAKVTFVTHGNIDDFTIEPMLLIPFVENAFKYGISTHEESPIDISIDAQKSQMTFEVRNEIKNIIHKEAKGTGLGIENTRNKLDLLYGQNYTLNIKKESNVFDVTLKIVLSTV